MRMIPASSVFADAGGATAQHALAVRGGTKTRSPARLASGMLSPVSIASLMFEVPSITSPSTGTLAKR